MKETQLKGLLGLVLIVIAFLLGLFKARKVRKQTVADFYRISRPTLGKWVIYFQADMNAADWKDKKALSYFEEQYLKEAFGEDSSMVLNKKQIVVMTDSDYKTVSANVKRNLSKIGISLTAWEACSTFPPKVSQKIVDMLEGRLAA